MPQNGFCADSKCDKEIRRLYECHCCLKLICINHLNEHDENEKFHSFIQQLKTKTDLVRSNMENRLKIIEKERKFLEKANHLLDGKSHSIVEMKKILEDFNQLPQTNHFQESVIKVEPSLSDVTNCPSAFQYTNENDCSIQIVSSESNLDLTQDSEIENSMTADQNILLNLSDNSAQDNNKNQRKSIRPYRFIGYCPLTFDGAYGLHLTKHSIRLCSNEGQRPILLYGHLTSIHTFKPTSAAHLIRAIAKDQDPKTTILFDNTEDIIDRSRRIECPFRKGIIHVFDCDKKDIPRVPCKYRSIPTLALKSHLKYWHQLSDSFSQQLAQYHKDNRTIDH